MTDQNKKLVRDFYELAFNQHKPREAAKRYIAYQYKQHNPFVPNGVAPFVDYFEGYFNEHPKSHVVISHIVADGDFVVLHLNSKANEKDRAGRSSTFSAWKTARSLSIGMLRRTFPKKRQVATRCSSDGHRQTESKQE
jgi:predicted SnoaL-like aldol condensation-catalyzing enzyme